MCRFQTGSYQVVRNRQQDCHVSSLEVAVALGSCEAVQGSNPGGWGLVTAMSM